MATKIDIGGELNPRTVEGIVADASTIIDRTADKMQDEINADVEEALAGKEATITDLSTIRSGAAAGATAVQPADLNDVTRYVETGPLEPLLDPSDYATTDQLAELGQEVSVLKNGQATNYGVGYTDWEIRSGMDSSTITANSFSLSTSGNLAFGHRFDLVDTPFSIGDSVYFAIKNVQGTLDRPVFVIIFYTSADVEISRVSLTMGAGFNYSSASIPANTDYFIIRIQSSRTGTLSGEDFLVSTSAFDEDTEFGTMLGVIRLQEALEELGITGISSALGQGVGVAMSQKFVTEFYHNVFGETTSESISVTSGTQLLQEFAFDGFAGLNYTFFLPNTPLIDANGIKVRAYKNGSEVFNFDLRTGSIVDFTANGDFDKIRLVRSATGIIGTGTFTFTIKLIAKLLSREETQGAIGYPVYVSPTGVDTAAGTKDAPFKTIAKALSVSSRVVMLAGVYDAETIKPEEYDYPGISIIGQDAEKVVVNFGTAHLVDNGGESLVSGYTKVYSVSCPTFPFASGANNAFMWQDGVADPGTLIDVADRHPLQRGRAYRCDSTKIKQVASIAAIEALPANEFGWYWESETMYFSRPQSSSASHPIVIPQRDAWFIDSTGNKTAKKQVAVSLNNIEVRYAGINLMYLANCEISDVLVKYNYVENGGCFYIYACQNCSLIRCEAAGVTNGTSIGDGFNVDTAGVADDPTALCLSLLMRDCWAHDVNDDGYSDHDNSEVTIDGGLFEFCGKGGITPAYGSNDIIKNAISRYNAGAGIYCTGTPAVAREMTNVFAVGCLCYGQQYGFKADTDCEIKCVDCLSKDNQVGFGGGGSVYCYNCGSSGDVAAKDSGAIVEVFTPL